MLQRDDAVKEFSIEALAPSGHVCSVECGAQPWA
jgi:hypothetical protein